jgi:hypothetical protein
MTTTLINYNMRHSVLVVMPVISAVKVITMAVGTVLSSRTKIVPPVDATGSIAVDSDGYKMT